MKGYKSVLKGYKSVLKGYKIGLKGYKSVLKVGCSPKKSNSKKNCKFYVKKISKMSRLEWYIKLMNLL